MNGGTIKPEEPKKDIAGMLRNLMSPTSEKRFVITREMPESILRKSQGTATTKEKPNEDSSVVWSESDIRHLVKVLSSPIVAWKPPQSSLTPKPGGEITLDDIGGVVRLIIPTWNFRSFFFRSMRYPNPSKRFFLRLA